ncbi:MAG: MiaB/RimO family radical SAM methylthiotransferase [Desulfovibrionales bacterium]
MRFFLHTIGCKINQYETHSLREAWILRGHVETRHPDNAELILVNSCAVTNRAVQDLRNAVRRFHRAQPEASILVTGCAAQVFSSELAELPGVVAVIPQSRKPELASWPDFPGILQELTISSYFRSRAVLKIQDGCSHGCTYCIVPLTRGPSRSRAPKVIMEEAERLLQAGIREITLSGINLRQYGRDLPDPIDFWEMLRMIDSRLAPEWHSRARLRISSLEPSELTDKGLDVLAGCRMVCPHLHISLQSGSPDVLRRMGRGHYSPRTIESFVDRLTKTWPLFGLGVDLLVGFPGESESQHQETIDLCSSLPLSYAHVFPFSPRPGTPAAEFSEQIPGRIKKERTSALRRMVLEKQKFFLNRLIREDSLEMILEGANRGRCQYYAECTLNNSSSARKGSLISVKPSAVSKERILANELTSTADNRRVS